MGRPKESATLIYRPKAGDPAEVLWNGVRFRANEGVTVKHRGMIESARGNSHFEIEGEDKEEAPDLTRPKTAEEYRRHAVEWFKTARTSAELEGRWTAEEQLREDVGVGTDDEEWLASLYDPRLAELKKADAKD